MQYADSQKYAAEFIGTAFLLAAVVGSGIMAETLAGGNAGLALLCNTIPTGAALYVLITMLGPISGGHLNPVVTLVFALRREISVANSLGYTFFQVTGGLTGVMAAHLMFDLEVVQYSQQLRTGYPIWFAEVVATFGLVLTILVTLKSHSRSVAMAVALYITAAYWFTASTSFANPAVTIGRSFTDTYSGIHPGNMPVFILSQVIGGLLAWCLCNWLLVQRTNP